MTKRRTVSVDDRSSYSRKRVETYVTWLFAIEFVAQIAIVDGEPLIKLLP